MTIRFTVPGPPVTAAKDELSDKLEASSVPRVAPTTGGLTNTCKGSDRMSKRICSIDGCTNQAKARGWCIKHYNRWNTYGDPLYYKTISAKDQERFWKYAPKDSDSGCWEWSGGRDADGYGVTWLNGKTWRASRFAWTVLFGEIPEGQVVRHRCDNPPCVNPSHLVIGTHKQNTQDAIERNRFPVGDRNSATKLSEDLVRMIRDQHSRGASARSLARVYGVSRNAIEGIVGGVTWRHVA